MTSHSSILPTSASKIEGRKKERKKKIKKKEKN
jgi:hypothetical protein